jgi:hypothetical protein
LFDVHGFTLFKRLSDVKRKPGHKTHCLLAALKIHGTCDIRFETTVTVIPHKNVTKVGGYFFSAVGFKTQCLWFQVSGVGFQSNSS